MVDRFRLSLETTEASVPLISLVRRHTGQSISALRELISARQPILDETPHHNQFTEFIARVTKLLDDLEAEGVRYLVEVDGSPESPQYLRSVYLRSVFQRWLDIGIQTRRMTDLESGEPCIETLEWLKRESPSDVFKQTLKQIVESDGYECDEETISWANRELDSANLNTASDGDDGGL